MNIGSHLLQNNLILAPMAGVTDKPFRQLCRQLGAGMVVSEMITSNPALYNSRKTRLRLDHHGEVTPRVVQIAGADPVMLAEAARFNVVQGAEIIDINMGCPAKKVCNVRAGSALLRDEYLVASILEQVVNAVDVPVTLKIRTGWDLENKNAIKIARLAENSGIQALAIHGRTRACGFNGTAEHETTARVKANVSIPVIANGDISSAKDAALVLSITGADGLMIGRAAQGNPWIFREIAHYLATGDELPAPDENEIRKTIIDHLNSLYAFYGEYQGIRIARKHIAWYCEGRQGATGLRARVNKAETCKEQLRNIQEYFNDDFSDYQGGLAA